MAGDSTATSSADSTLAVGSVGAAAELEGSASTGAASPGAPDARINALMSKWQKSEAEIQRLQGLLATAVTREAEQNARINEQEGGIQDAVAVARTNADTAQARVAELEQQFADLTAQTVRLQFIADNPDLAEYRDILPNGIDKAKLESAAITIRTARESESDRRRTHATIPAAAGQTPRKPMIAMTPAEIDTYLRNAPPDEFETRLAEVTGRTS